MEALEGLNVSTTADRLSKVDRIKLYFHRHSKCTNLNVAIKKIVIKSQVIK